MQISIDGLKPVDADGLFRLRGEPDAVPEPLLRVLSAVVGDGRVARNAVIPEADRSLLPLHADLKVLALADMLWTPISSVRSQTSGAVHRMTYGVQEVQQGFGLLVLQSDDALCEGGVDEERLLPSSLEVQEAVCQ